jgi:hypothetical protein
LEHALRRKNGASMMIYEIISDIIWRALVG